MKKIFLTFGIALLGFTAVFAQDSDVYEPTEAETEVIETQPMEEPEAIEDESEAIENEAIESDTDAIRAEDEVDAKTEDSDALIEE